MDTKEFIVQLIKNKEIHSPKANTILDKKGKPFYELNWQKTEDTSDSVTSFSITFKFDMDTFLSVYEKKYPSHKIKPDFVLTGFEECFVDVAKYALTSGMDNLIELAIILYEKRGEIVLKDFGV